MALMGASQNGHLEVVEYLLKAGANVKAQTNDGQDALLLAKDQDIRDILQKALELD